MIKADQFSYPMAFTGTYPDGFAGYTFLDNTQQGALHPGIDWNWGGGEADYGKPVQAIANGIVVHTSEQAGIGYGEIIVLKHELTDQLYEFLKSRYQIDARTIYSFYAHLKDSIVTVGQEVKRGELIGYCGNSGTGASHLHQELYKPIPGTQWRYWPTLAQGWDATRLKQYYVDTYDLIQHQPPVISEDTQAELKKAKQMAEDYNSDRVAVYAELGLEGSFNRTLAIEEIKRLKGIAKTVSEKDKELLQLREDLEKAKKELEEHKGKIEDVQIDTKETQVATEVINAQVDSTIEKVKDIEKKIDSAVRNDEPDWYQPIIDFINRIFRR